MNAAPRIPTLNPFGSFAEDGGLISPYTIVKKIKRLAKGVLFC